MYMIVSPYKCIPNLPLPAPVHQQLERLEAAPPEGRGGDEGAPLPAHRRGPSIITIIIIIKYVCTYMYVCIYIYIYIHIHIYIYRERERCCLYTYR